MVDEEGGGMERTWILTQKAFTGAVSWSVLIVCPCAVAFVSLRMPLFQNRDYCIYFEISINSDDNGIQRYLQNSIILCLP